MSNWICFKSSFSYTVDEASIAPGIQVKYILNIFYLNKKKIYKSFINLFLLVNQINNLLKNTLKVSKNISAYFLITILSI